MPSTVVSEPSLFAALVSDSLRCHCIAYPRPVSTQDSCALSQENPPTRFGFQDGLSAGYSCIRPISVGGLTSKPAARKRSKYSSIVSANQSLLGFLTRILINGQFTDAHAVLSGTKKYR